MTICCLSDDGWLEVAGGRRRHQLSVGGVQRGQRGPVHGGVQLLRISSQLQTPGGWWSCVPPAGRSPGPGSPAGRPPARGPRTPRRSRCWRPRRPSPRPRAAWRSCPRGCWRCRGGWPPRWRRRRRPGAGSLQSTGHTSVARHQLLTPSSGHGEGPPGGLHQLGQLRLLPVDGVVQVRRPVCGDEVCSDLALLSTTQHLAPVLPSKLCSLAEVAAWAEQEAAPSTRSRARGDMVRVRDTVGSPDSAPVWGAAPTEEQRISRGKSRGSMISYLPMTRCSRRAPPISAEITSHHLTNGHFCWAQHQGSLGLAAVVVT